MKRLVAILAMLECWAFAAQYDGADGRSYSKGAITDPGGALTMAFWYRPGTNTDQGLFFIRTHGASYWDGDYSGFWNTGTGYNIRFYDQIPATHGLTAIVTLTNNVWWHIAATKTSISNRILWVNGVPRSTNSTSINNATTRTNVLLSTHDASGANGYPMRGGLAEAAVWNVALDAGQIAALASGAIPVTVAPANLVFYAPLAGEATNDVNTVGKIVTHAGGVSTTDHPRIYR